MIIEKIPIILTDWAKYPLRRIKKLGTERLNVGLGNILENMQLNDSGYPFEVFLIINGSKKQDKKKYLNLKIKYNFIKKIFFRENDGFDFGAYNFGYNILKSKNYLGEVVFMNSSIDGPHKNNWLKKYHNLFNSNKKIGLCGISMNSYRTNLKLSRSFLRYLDKIAKKIGIEILNNFFWKEDFFSPHIQSFFIYTRVDILKKVFARNLPGIGLVNHQEIISEGEIELSRKILKEKFGICSSLWPEWIYFKGMVWDKPKGDIRFLKKYKKNANRL